ncbi:MAG: hypothetical protein H6733_11930 [Alphaproteobacteria bacterium]|nr:hypothetical protein [Alphaproteobacteria bacterium]
MAKARPSVQKRLKEARAHDKALAKAARKAERDAARAERADVPDGVDPDLIGLTVGPQPVPWLQDDEA